MDPDPAPASPAPRPRTVHTPTVHERPQGDTQVRYVTITSATTLRQTLLTPTAGKAIRLLRIKIVTDGASAAVVTEFYFGTGANITTNPKKVIDLLRIAGNAEPATRTYDRGRGPVGAINDVVSLRFTASASNNYWAIIEYTEEP